MTFPTFNKDDFDVFTIPGLEPRMEALIRLVRPKLTEIGDSLVPFLSAQCGQPMFPHVAKHARRTINPPADSWVAWSFNKKGYKAHPHFQVGLWSTHLFVQFAVIYESDNKVAFADQLEKHLDEIRRDIPAHFRWSLDHMQPQTTAHGDMSEDDFAVMIDKLKHVKKTEALCGIRVGCDDELLQRPRDFENLIKVTFERVMPLYRLAIE
ncbi:MAG: hypothetical protein K0Q59_2438 [Paenibacillus sp.]|jgi:uncharacterized protein YktB (UPF0637 family)|nr:hypothetical protein [Paenibacillus sp.]